MKRLVSQSFRGVPGLRSIATYHENPCVVVLHRKSAIVLRTFDLADILTFQNSAPRDIARALKRPTVELTCLVGSIWLFGGVITPVDVLTL